MYDTDAGNSGEIFGDELIFTAETQRRGDLRKDFIL
jgi:hypothetical protein